jgi:hypothetical protein
MRSQVEVRNFIEQRPRKTRSPYGTRFMMLSQRGITELSERLADKTIGMQAVRTLVAMLAHMDWENRVDVSQKELAIELGIAQTHLAKASRALLECGFIERMANRRGWYRVSPRLCWKGDVKHLARELREAA